MKMSIRTVVGRVLLPRDHSLGVEEGAVRASLHIVDGTGLEVDVERAGHVLAVARLGEEGRKAAVMVAVFLVCKAAIGLDKTQRLCVDCR